MYTQMFRDETLKKHPADDSVNISPLVRTMAHKTHIYRDASMSL